MSIHRQYQLSLLFPKQNRAFKKKKKCVSLISKDFGDQKGGVPRGKLKGTGKYLAGVIAGDSMI